MPYESCIKNQNEILLIIKKIKIINNTYVIIHILHNILLCTYIYNNQGVKTGFNQVLNLEYLGIIQNQEKTETLIQQKCEPEPRS